MEVAAALCRLHDQSLFSGRGSTTVTKSTIDPTPFKGAKPEKQAAPRRFILQRKKTQVPFEPEVETKISEAR